MLLNLSFERGLRGPETGEGFAFRPSAKFSWFLKKNRLHPGLEYYASTGPLSETLPASQQVHIHFPAVDLFINEKAEANLGVGVGVTDVVSDFVLHSISLRSLAWNDARP